MGGLAASRAPGTGRCGSYDGGLFLGTRLSLGGFAWPWLRADAAWNFVRMFGTLLDVA